MNNIIGYKAPFDLFTGTETPIKKGYVLVKHPKFEHVYVYSPFYEVGEGYGVCKEIVETWEAVYEELTETKELFNKIIGYKLLKDLPDLKQGTIFKKDNDEIQYKASNETNDYFYTEESLNNLKDWFEPVYEKSQEDLIHDIYKLSDKEFQAEFTKVMLEKYEIKEKE